MSVHRYGSSIPESAMLTKWIPGVFFEGIQFQQQQVQKGIPWREIL